MRKGCSTAKREKKELFILADLYILQFSNLI